MVELQHNSFLIESDINIDFSETVAIVRGAGNKECNGIYFNLTIRQYAPMYIKKSLYQDKSVILNWQVCLGLT